jgi:hypothetical protein
MLRDGTLRDSEDWLKIEAYDAGHPNERADPSATISSESITICAASNES